MNSNINQAFPLQTESPSLENIFVLIEEYEDANALRQFSILAISDNREYLRQNLQQKLDQDEYGFIQEKGLQEQSPNHFITNYDNGHVGYYIEEQTLHRYKKQHEHPPSQKKPSIYQLIQKASETNQKSTPEKTIEAQSAILHK